MATYYVPVEIRVSADSPIDAEAIVRGALDNIVAPRAPRASAYRGPPAPPATTRADLRYVVRGPAYVPDFVPGEVTGSIIGDVEAEAREDWPEDDEVDDAG